MTATAAPDSLAARPIIVRGHPSDAELAALTGVLVALRTQADAAASDTDETGRRPVGWTSRRHQLRLRPTPGPGAWRASSRLS